MKYINIIMKDNKVRYLRTIKENINKLINTFQFTFLIFLAEAKILKGLICIVRYRE